MRLDRFNAHAEGESLTPVPPETPALYVTSRHADADWSNWSDLTPDIVMPAIGRRFISYEIRNSKDFEFTDAHRDGYACGFETMPYHSFSHFWGADPHECDTTMFYVQLKYANQVYVVDEQPFLDMREEKLAERQRTKRKASEREATEIFSSIARSMVPLQDYKFDYMRPIYLIGRHLRADEAQIYVPAFKKRIAQAELARQARIAADPHIFDEFLRQPPAPEQSGQKPKPPHLRLVIDN